MKINAKSSLEEIEIYNIVEEILQIEDKIKEINEQRLVKENKSFNTQLRNPNNTKKKYATVARVLNEELIFNLKPYKILLCSEEQEANRLNEEISNINKQLKQLTTSSKGNIYKMSYEKIKEIINVKKTSDDIQMINREIESFDKISQMLNKSLSEYKNKLNELNECKMMNKEEKEAYKIDIVNLISQKESIEELTKIDYLHYYHNSEQIILKRELEVYDYEIEKVNSNNITKIIQSIIDLLNDQRNSNKNIIENQSINFKNIIQDAILENIKHKQSNQKKACDELFNEISIKILKIIDVNSNTLNSNNKDIFSLTIESLSQYLKYLTKQSYIEEILHQRFLLTTKQYKINKKKILNQINSIQNSITKLITQLDETESKIKDYEKKKSYFIENNKPKAIIELSKEEKDYIRYNENLSELINQKNDLKFTMEDIHNKIKEIKIEYQHKLNQLEVEQQNKIKEIEDDENNNDKRHIDSDDCIIKLQKKIDDNYILLKSKLGKSRETFDGNHITLYNKLINCINNNNAKNSFLIKRNSYSHSITDKSIHSIASYIELTKSKRSISSFHLFNSKNHSMKSSSMSDLYSNKQITKESELTIHFDNRSKNKSNFNQRHNKQSSSVSLYRKPMNYYNQITSLNEKTKLKETIKDLKAKITKTKYISNKYSAMQKIVKSLKENAICYYRNIIEGKEKRFNPLINSITSHSFNFTKAVIAVDDLYSNIKVKKDSYSGDAINIPIETIDSTIVSNITKQMIIIIRAIRRYKGIMAIENILQTEEIASINLSQEDKMRSITNNYFTFAIKMNNDQRIEFVFLNYEQFKVWLNGLKCLIKNKKQLSMICWI